MPLSDATTHFTRQLAANGCSVRTQRAYARDLCAFARWLGRDAALSTITPDDLARFLISDAVLGTPDGRPRKPITINRTKSGVPTCLTLVNRPLRLPTSTETDVGRRLVPV
jgi:site-specific recombinase XerD